MSPTTRSLALCGLLVLTGCEAPIDPDAPRAPTAEEIKALPKAAAPLAQKSYQEAIKEFREKKAKEEAARAAKDGSPVAPTDKKPDAPAPDASKAVSAKDAPAVTPPPGKPATPPATTPPTSETPKG
jgi:hypothetical protein